MAKFYCLLKIDSFDVVLHFLKQNEAATFYEFSLSLHGFCECHAFATLDSSHKVRREYKKRTIWLRNKLLK